MEHNPKAIPGIHSYCDRWCERCCFTSRCNVFENPRDVNPAEQDINNKAFWDRISRQFEQTLKFLQKIAAEQGIDLSTFSEEELQEIKRKEKVIQDKSEKHPLPKLGIAYARTVINWLNTNNNLKEKKEELQRLLNLGILQETHANGQAATIDDCLEIIQWYVHFIYVKLMRAVTSKLDNDREEDEGENRFQNDSNGSAKIALLAVDRCLQAWSALHQLVPFDEDEFLTIVGILQRIKTMAEQEFPLAYQFVRPGFDEANTG